MKTKHSLFALSLSLLPLAGLVSSCKDSGAAAQKPAPVQASVPKVTGKTYYISSKGSDTNNGTSANTPFATLAKANVVLVAGDALRLKRGERFSGTIKPAASGTAEAPIVIGSYGEGNKPIITGFKAVTGWTARGGGLYEATLPSFPTGRLQMVRFNNKLQPVGRLPKAGLGWKSGSSSDSWFELQSHATNKQITTTDEFPDVTGGEIVQKKYQWIIDRGRIDSISTAAVNGQTVRTINITEFPTPHPPYNSFDKNGFFIQNHVKCLTEPGEWAYDEATHKLTMFFGTSSPANHVVEVATLEHLADLSGKSHITLDNLVFIGSNSDMVRLDNSPFASFDACDFSFSGRNGISVNISEFASHSNSHHGAITNCTISNINNNGINLEENPNWTITRSTLANIGMHAGMGLNGDGQYIGIFAPGEGSLLQYNDISNIGYSGLYFVGSGTEIRNNYLHHFCMVKSDGGGIYTYGGKWPRKVHEKPRVIDRNIVHDGVGNTEGVYHENGDNPYTPQAHGIYMDGNTTNVVITNNTSFRNSTSGLWLGSNGNITASGNTLANNNTQQLAINDLQASEDPPNTPYPGSHPANLNVHDNICFAFEPEQLCLKMDLNNKPADFTPAQYVSSVGTLANNLYLRPVREPDDVSTTGYPQAPTFKDYPGGGIVNTVWDGLFLSLNTWQEKYGQDKGTKKTSRTVANASELRLEYNPTNAVAVKALPGVFEDAKGAVYTNTITLQPYSSAILMQKK